MVVQQTSIDTLKSRMRGPVIGPGDSDYESARKVYNAMIDRYPAMIARCLDVGDVITAVQVARQNNLPLAVRGGGHNGAGLGTVDDGLVIDLSLMRSVEVDPLTRTARVTGGCTLRDMDRVTHEFGLAVPSGINSTTGVSGLTLGGGIGHLTRQYGLTIDNLLAADVVLADGSVVTASATQHPDLFWAIRGGGGNFGVVTSFLFRLHPVHTVIAGPTAWSLDQAAEAMRFYRDTMSHAPEELSGVFAFYTIPPASPFPAHLHLQKVCGVLWCYTGPAEDAERVFAPIRAFGPPVLDGIKPMPFPTLQMAVDALYPAGLQWYWRAHFINELLNAAIERYVERGHTLPTPHSRIQLFPMGGAAGRVDKQATAFYHRDAKWAQVTVGVDPDPAKAELISEWAMATWEALHPYAADGGYVNFMMDEGQTRVEATYRDNYRRLVEVKNTYDPTNLFHINQNIKPTLPAG